MNQEILNISSVLSKAVPVDTIYLFGSFAYGSPSENSDYDFYMVIPDGGLRPLEAMRRARKSLFGLERKTAVDILADYRSRFDCRKQFNTLERKVASEGVVLYERK